MGVNVRVLRATVITMDRKNRGGYPEARLTAAKALGELGAAARLALPALRTATANETKGQVRAAMIRATKLIESAAATK